MAFLLIQRNNIIKIWHYVKKKSCLKVKTACGNLLIYEHVSECSHVMCISRNRLVEARTMTTESFLHIEASKSVRWYQFLYLLCLFQSLVIVIVVFVFVFVSSLGELGIKRWHVHISPTGFSCFCILFIGWNFFNNPSKICMKKINFILRKKLIIVFISN